MSDEDAANDRLEKARVQVLNSLKMADENFIVEKQIIAHKMRVYKARYDAAISAGFDAGQAIYLACKKDEL